MGWRRGLVGFCENRRATVGRNAFPHTWYGCVNGLRCQALTAKRPVPCRVRDPDTLRATLILLERQGLILRLPSPTDGRARTVALTTKGDRTFQKLGRQHESLRAELVSSLTKRLSSQLPRRLQRLSAPAGTPRPTASRRTRVVAEAGVK